MTTHSGNIGSQKVELVKQEQPLWRLKANYLLRQLARIWYGKIPKSDYLHSVKFETLFLDVMCQFIEDHGGNSLEVHKRIKQRKEEFEAIHGKEIAFKDQVSKLDWLVKNGMPNRLYETFSRDETIQSILLMVEWLINYEEEGKEPPYKPAAWMESFEHYEQLPVLEPEPTWRLIANLLQCKLARIWYGKAEVKLGDFDCSEGEFKRLFWELLVTFAIEKGITRDEFDEEVRLAKADFEEKHGCEIDFRTPLMEIIWAAKTCLPESWAMEFLSDPQVKFIFTAAELIRALIKAGLQPPYERYAVSFKPLEEYEKLRTTLYEKLL
jgi:hypothetical protein